MKVLIVDDHTETRNSLIRLCERREDVQVVGEAACGNAAIDAAGTLNPDIMLLDVDLPDMSGFELLRAVGGRYPSLGHHGVELRRSCDAGLRGRRLDYFVMPVTAERFDRAMTRARHRLSYALPGHGFCSSKPPDPGRTGRSIRRGFWWASGSGGCIRSIRSRSTTSRRTATMSPCAPARWNTSAAIRSNACRCSLRSSASSASSGRCW